MRIKVLELEHTSDPGATTCLNDAWELNADGACQPKSDKFELSCNQDGMTVKMSGEVVPDAVDVFLLGDCSGTLDSGSQGSTQLSVPLNFTFKQFSSLFYLT